MLRTVVAAVHILSLAIGVSSNVARIIGLADPDDPARRRLLFAADNVAGLVSLTWVGSGLWRAFGDLEKGTDYYLGNTFFQLKMGLLVVSLGLELWPMITFIRWRYALRDGKPIDTSRAPLFRRLMVAQLAVMAAMVVFASLMADGFGAPAPPEGWAGVRQVLAARCLQCHSAAVRSGDLDLESDPRAALLAPSAQWPELTRVVPGDAERSLLLLKLRGQQGEGHGLAMPPTGPLDDAELGCIDAWVRAGALP